MKLIGIVAVIIVLGGGWYLLSKSPAPAPTTTVQTPAVTETTSTTTVAQPAAPSVTVTYTDKGFSPKSVSVSVGTTVTFVNQSTSGMWVASAKHPSHTVYSGTDVSKHCPDTAGTAFDECTAVTAGGSYSFVFAKIGDWKYHNHVKSTDFGSVTVTAAATSTAVTPI